MLSSVILSFSLLVCFVRSHRLSFWLGQVCRWSLLRLQYRQIIDDQSINHCFLTPGVWIATPKNRSSVVFVVQFLGAPKVFLLVRGWFQKFHLMVFMFSVVFGVPRIIEFIVFTTLFLSKCSSCVRNGPNTASESTVSNPELSEFFCPHRVPGRDLSEFPPAYYLCAKAN